MSLTKEAMYEMVKEAGTIKYSCGHEGRCRCTSQHVTNWNVPCPDCQKQAEYPEEEKTTAGKGMASTVKGLADKAKTVGAFAVGGLASLGTPTPPQKMNPRY